MKSLPMPERGRPSRAIASSPIPTTHRTPQPPNRGDPAIRSMRLKVLYTFDGDKTNCLARWPHPIDIRTAFLDTDTEVGVIELKTCLQAIATASPEIVAKLGQDYTVYAYDYSEYETPLVGQGMLSWILASASPTPGAPAHQSRTIVTGRVSKNTFGLFASNAQETLEVKLRLVPVPTSLQSEYIESMKKYREISTVVPGGFDPQAWTAFMQANPGFLQQSANSRSQSPVTGVSIGQSFGIEHVQRLLSGDGSRAKSTAAKVPISRANSTATLDMGHQIARMPSPASSVASSVTAPKRRGRKPGPNYKGPQRKNAQPSEAAPSESGDPGYFTGDERAEEGPSRKRAKVVQAEWDGKGDLGKQPGSLRVAASTAASVRIHQPTAVRPGNVAHLALEGQPRAPTPIAGPAQTQGRARLPMTKSNLGQQALLAENERADSYNPLGDFSKPSPMIESSPEKSIAASSPFDIASSPPLYPGNSTTQSSPRLPGFPTHSFEDSGFMSGTFDDLFDDDHVKLIEHEEFADTAHRTDTEIALDHINKSTAPVPGTNHLRKLTGQHSQNSEADMRLLSSLPQLPKPDHKVSHPPLTRTTSSINQPVIASDPVRPSRLSRSQTWSGDQGEHPASESANEPSLSLNMQQMAPTCRSRRGSDMGGQSGVKRKAAIQSNLKEQVAAGELPPYCDNCGAIETPTWRKAWAKIHSGTPEHVRLSEADGGIIAWQTLQTDSTGTICLYRIIKKSLAKHDEGFSDMLLCNPCGIFLYIRKCMRPKEFWDKNNKGPDDKNKRRPKGKQARRDSTQSSSIAISYGTGVNSEPSSPKRAAGQNEAIEGEPQLPPLKRRRASNAESQAPQKKSIMDEATAAAALERAIESSPHKFQGSKSMPIDLGDLTPQPTRRILFPSPSQIEQLKTRQSPSANSRKDQKTLEECAKSPIPALILKDCNKENKPPSQGDDFDRFFNDQGFVHAGGPTTPSPPNKKGSSFQTPQRTPKQINPTTADFFSSAARALLRPAGTPRRTPKHNDPDPQFTPFTAHLNQLLSDTNGGSPQTNGHHAFEFPSLPSLRNTPNSARLLDFDFTNFDSQDLISTDIPVPSSPPVWNFDQYNDNDIGHQNLWADYAIESSTTGTVAKATDQRMADEQKERESVLDVAQPMIEQESVAAT